MKLSELVRQSAMQGAHGPVDAAALVLLSAVLQEYEIDRAVDVESLRVVLAAAKARHGL